VFSAGKLREYVFVPCSSSNFYNKEHERIASHIMQTSDWFKTSLHLCCDANNKPLLGTKIREEA